MERKYAFDSSRVFEEYLENSHDIGEEAGEEQEDTEGWEGVGHAEVLVEAEAVALLEVAVVAKVEAKDMAGVAEKDDGGHGQLDHLAGLTVQVRPHCHSGGLPHNGLTQAWKNRPCQGKH